jgi:hypothetical protein
MKITTFIGEVGAPNYKQVAKNIMAKFTGLTKPQATDIAKQVIDYDHKTKRRHPQDTLEGIRKGINDTFESLELPVYLDAA